MGICIHAHSSAATTNEMRPRVDAETFVDDDGLNKRHHRTGTGTARAWISMAVLCVNSITDLFG